MPDHLVGLSRYRLECLGNRKGTKGKHGWRGAYLTWHVNDAYGSSDVTVEVDVQGGVGEINLKLV